MPYEIKLKSTTLGFPSMKWLRSKMSVLLLQVQQYEVFDQKQIFQLTITGSAHNKKW